MSQLQNEATNYSLASANFSKLAFFSCSLAFTVLLPLKLDEWLELSFWVVMIPFWVLNGMVFCGCLVGVVNWFLRPGNTLDRRDVIGMGLCTILFFLTFWTEVMVCLKVEGIVAIDWRIVLMPLYGGSVIAVFIGCYLRLYPRNFPNADFEDFMTFGFMPWIFIALKLSGVVDWSWHIVFLPVWLVFALLIAGSVSYVVRTILIFNDREQSLQNRMFWLAQSINSVFVTFPSLTFMILLSLKLEGLLNTSWETVFAPLDATLAFAVWQAAIRKGGNPHWFGRTHVEGSLRRLLPQLGEVSYSTSLLVDVPDAQPDDTSDHLEFNQHSVLTFSAEKDNQEVIIPPVISIELPD